MNERRDIGDTMVFASACQAGLRYGSARWGFRDSFCHTLLAMLFLAACGSAQATELVRVGGAHFPPYVIKPESAEATGLLPELLAALNGQQHEFEFVMLPTAIPRRFRDFQAGRIDMAVFENPNWGWQDIPGARIDMGLEDAEVFVAQRRVSRDQEYFRTLVDKRLALYSGYHYGFAGFDADPEYLTREFNALMTYSHDSNLLMVLRGRADIALVTRSYLGMYLEKNPDQAGQFLVSTRVDQHYRHYALLRPGAPISPERFTALLEQLRAKGDLQRIFGRYQIQVSPASLDSSALPDGRD